MRQADKLIIVQCVLAQTANGDAHAAFEVAVQLGLRTIVFFKIGQELFGSARQVQFLRKSLKVSPALNDLLFGRFFLKVHKDCGGVTVQYRYADALGCDDRKLCLLDVVADNLTKQFERLLLGFLFLAADKRNDVFHHLRPVLKCLACA